MKWWRKSPRSKSLQKWIDNDPLRAKWWDSQCPNSDGDTHSHYLVFSVDNIGGNVKSVKCMEGCFKDVRGL